MTSTGTLLDRVECPLSQSLRGFTLALGVGLTYRRKTPNTRSSRAWAKEKGTSPERSNVGHQLGLLNHSWSGHVVD